VVAVYREYEITVVASTSSADVPFARTMIQLYDPFMEEEKISIQVGSTKDTVTE